METMPMSYQAACTTCIDSLIDTSIGSSRMMSFYRKHIKCPGFDLDVAPLTVKMRQTSEAQECGCETFYCDGVVTHVSRCVLHERQLEMDFKTNFFDAPLNINELHRASQCYTCDDPNALPTNDNQLEDHQVHHVVEELSAMSDAVCQRVYEYLHTSRDRRMFK
jgi:hypothetical protein